MMAQDSSRPANRSGGASRVQPQVRIERPLSINVMMSLYGPRGQAVDEMQLVPEESQRLDILLPSASASYWGGECFSSVDSGQTAMFWAPQSKLCTRLSLSMRSLASAQAGLWGHSRSGSPIVR